MKRLAVLLLLAACTTTKPYTPPIPANFDNALWAILIEDDGGTVLYEQNADKLIDPRVQPQALRLRHDRQLPRPHDPTEHGGLPRRRRPRRPRRRRSVARLLALLPRRRLRRSSRKRCGRSGMTNIRDLVIDVSAFDRVLYPGGWKIGNIGSDYSAPVDATPGARTRSPTTARPRIPRCTPGPCCAMRSILRGIRVANIPREHRARASGANKRRQHPIAVHRPAPADGAQEQPQSLRGDAVEALVQRNVRRVLRPRADADERDRRPAATRSVSSTAPASRRTTSSPHARR